MFLEMTRLENIARVSMGDNSEADPLPLGAHRGGFGYFWHGIFVVTGLAATLLVLMSV